MIEGVLSEEVVPQNEDRGSSLTREVVVPFLQGSNELIALLADTFFREEQKLSLSVDVDQHLFSLLDQRISVLTEDKVKQRLLGKFGVACRDPSSSFYQKLFFSGIMCLTFYV